jgi:hypothetical protein
MEQISFSEHPPPFDFQKMRVSDLRQPFQPVRTREEPKLKWQFVFPVLVKIFQVKRSRNRYLLAFDIHMDIISY